MSEASGAESDVSKQEPRLKVVVVGDGASGKTSLITRYTQDMFGKAYDQTVGLDFFNKRVKFTGDRSALLQIWDIGGQTLGGKMLDKYVYGSDIALFVYDITNSKSFDDVSDWMMSVDSMIENEKCYHVLVGNKGDLQHLRTVTKEQHDIFAKDNNMGHFIVSAKTGDSIDLMFKKVVAHKLKIRLGRHDVDATTKVIPATINEVPEPVQSKNLQVKRKSILKSAICGIQ